MKQTITVIAIDGPSASGKSTVSRGVARALGLNYVDSGAMYRAVTWKALEEQIDVTDLISVLALLRRMQITFTVVEGAVRMLIDGKFPGRAIREPRVEKQVSVIAAIPEVRQLLVAQQRSLTKLGGLVMEGRDIGSVVFPDTPHKFYIDADPAVRARRRQEDFAAMHIAASNEGVAASLRKRDQLDSQRKVAPLQIALGATVIDNSRNTAEQTIQQIVKAVRG